MNLSILLSIAFILSLAMTYSILLFAKKNHLIDIPNARSSHQHATPRGGGLAIVLSFLLGSIILCFQSLISLKLALTLCLGGGALALIGFYDDVKSLPANIRFLVHLLAASLALYWIGNFSELTIAQYHWAWGWLGYLATGILIVWLINLTNFMDGIDGIASIQTLTVVIGAITLLLLTKHSILISPFALLFATVLGFLMFNWPPAKIFMGDVGSGFLGYVTIVLLLYACHQTHTQCWPWLILLGTFLVDATLTLLTRMLTGQAWLQAHCQHAYQYAAKYFGQHKIVSTAVGIINLVWLLPWSIAALHWTRDGFYCLICAYAPLIVICKVFTAGAVDTLQSSHPTS